MNKLLFFLSVVLLLGTATMSTTSCGDETEYEGPDTLIFKFYNVIHFDGDTVAFNNETHVDITNSGDLIDNDTTVFTNHNHNDNTGGGSGDNGGGERQIVVPAGYHCWQIPVPELHFYHQFVGGEDEFFERFYPTEDEVPVGFYDGNSNPTTLSFDFDDWEKMGYSNGKQGADLDKTRDLMILRLYEEFAEVKPFRINRRYVSYAEYGKAYLVGITGQDGNSPNERTGRTLMGVSENGRYVILMVAEDATSLEAYDTFHSLFPNSPAMVVGGGNSSRCFLPEWRGAKTVPLVIKVTPMMKL